MTINSHPSIPFNGASFDTSGTPIPDRRGLPCIHRKHERIGNQYDPIDGRLWMLANCSKCYSTIVIGEIINGKEYLIIGVNHGKV